MSGRSSILSRKKAIAIVAASAIAAAGWLVYSSAACGCSIMWANEAKVVATRAYQEMVDCRKSHSDSRCDEQRIEKQLPDLTGGGLRDRLRITSDEDSWRIEVQIYEREGFDDAFFMIEGRNGMSIEEAQATCVVTSPRFRHICPDGTWKPRT